MKGIFILPLRKLLVVLLVFQGAIVFADIPNFYYHFDDKIMVTESETEATVISAGGEFTFHNLMSAYGLSAADEPEYQIKKINKSLNMYLVSSNENNIQNLKENSSSMQEKFYHPVLVDKNGSKLFITNTISIKFKEDIDQSQRSDLLVRYGLTLMKKNKLFIVLTMMNGDNPLEVANEIQESGLVEYSTPNFVTKMKLHAIPNDEYFGKQFQMHNTGQEINDGHTGTVDADVDGPQAWEITQGDEAIIVAVLDEGLTNDHPDLPNDRQVIIPGCDYYYGDDDPSPEDGSNANHGNATAGIVAATQNNNEGVSGIAPNVKIMPLKIADYWMATSDVIAQAFIDAESNGAHIISNSYSASEHSALTDAIQWVVNNGRGGLGCLVVFSAGNTADHSEDEPGWVEYPGEMDEVLCVGSSDRNDDQSVYSPTDDELDIVAPSHRAYYWQIDDEDYDVWTMDIPGEEGYNLNVYGHLPPSGTNHLSYTGRMGGTSSACPLVAGIAALVLSESPTMTEAELYDRLINTANKVGGFTYDNNGAGRCNDMGFGRVNALGALLNARIIDYTINSGVVEEQVSSGVDIRLRPGFHAMSGSEFHAVIQ